MNNAPPKSPLKFLGDYSVWALVLIFFAVLVLPAQTVYAQKVATLEKVKGDVRIFKPGKTKGLKGRNGMALFSKYTIKTTTAESFTDVVFKEGGTVRMMPNSEMTLASVEISQGKLKAKIDLITGKIFNVVDKLAENAYYEVKTRTATSGVKGTIFSAETTERESVFMVKEGAVEAVNLEGVQKAVLVTDLKKTIVQAALPPSEPIPLTPEEIAMFDILDDFAEETRSDLIEETMEAVKEDIIEDMLP